MGGIDMYKKFTFSAWLGAFEHFENITHYKRFIKANPGYDKLCKMQYEQYLMGEDV